MPAPPDPARRERVTTRLLAVVAAALLVGLLKMTRPVSLPLAASVVVIALLLPVDRWLERRVPRRLALGLTVLVLFATVAAAVTVVALIAGSVGERAAEYAPQLRAVADALRARLAGYGVRLPEAGDAGAGVLGALPGLLLSALTSLIFLLAFSVLGLVEAREFRRRVASHFADARTREIFDVGGRIAHRFRRYFGAKIFTAALTGTATGSYCAAVGLDFALVWGLLTFLGEFVPGLGSFVVLVPPTLFALLQFGATPRTLVILAGLAVIQLTLSNYIDPRIEGRRTSVSPLLVLVSIAFWGWMWGGLGALFAVPFTVGLLIACDHFDGTRWIASLLLRDPGPEGGDARSTRAASSASAAAR
ncbi:MAG TPA: AI-2E family transporter [Gemmatimonadaceae bacterium]|nr:AI-2E family transporter [Gemmatimonadaceae bacterium]